MASYTKAASGWRVRVRRGDTSESSTHRTKAEAQAWAAEKEAEAVATRNGGLPKKTALEAFERYRDEISPTKAGGAKESLRINAFIRDMPRVMKKQIADVTTEDLIKWRDIRLTLVAGSSVARDLTVIKAIFETARREWKWIRTDPAKDVRRPPDPPHRTRRPTDDETERLCLALGFSEQMATRKQEEVAIAWLFAIETAMRSGEILALTAPHVSFERRVAHIPRSKNGSARDVPLTPRAAELLRLLPCRHGKFFTLSDGVRDALFRKARDAALIEDLHFHDSRREGTCRWAKRVDVLTLARITGHKNINELLTYYQTDMAEVAMGVTG